MAADKGQQFIGGISRRSVLRGGLLAGAGVATVGAASAVLTGTANAAASGWQLDWAFCVFCNALWWAKNPSPSDACPGSGKTGEHGLASGDYVYEVEYGVSGLNNSSDPQPDWRFCTNCCALFWGGFGGACWANRVGISPGPHTAGTTNYDLWWNGSGTDAQENWRFCGKCSVIFWQGSSQSGTGVCAAASGGPHFDGSGTVYEMFWHGTWA
jgi:hypothetical protein